MTPETGTDPFYLKPEHQIWCRREADGTVTVGFLAAAGERGAVLNVAPRRIGKHVRKGISCATLEWLDWVEPVRTPVSGTVVAVNEAVRADPALVGRDPFGAAWLVRLAPDDWEADSADLVLDEPAAEPWGDISLEPAPAF